MISLSATSYDPNGAIIIDAIITNPYQAERRGSVTATLDGGSAFYDTGYSITDRTLSAQVINPEISLLQTLEYLVAYYGQVILSCELGCYVAVLSFSTSRNVLSINLRLVSRLDQ